MSDFKGMEDLLQDFLIEAGDLLSDVDNKLVELERAPGDKGLLNDIFRGFHTIKGGAGFLNASELVTICHLTENLFDKLRNDELTLSPAIMDVIMAATGEVRDMFGDMESGQMPHAAPAPLLDQLKRTIAGDGTAPAPAASIASTIAAAPAVAATPAPGTPDWDALHRAITGNAPPKTIPAPAAAIEILDAEKPVAPAKPRAVKQDAPKERDSTIRIDTARLDQVLNLSGEIGLTKNRLNALRTQICNGDHGPNTLQSLDSAVSQLDLLVSDLQNAVMKTRMQPIGRLFQKYPRIARDLARSLGKEVELILDGEETEIDKTMIEDLSDPIIHLVRNAVDHGVESTEDRLALGKPAKASIKLEARQEGDHIIISVSDDGKGMDPEKLRAKAVQKGLISEEDASGMDERQSFNLVLLPGFSTAEKVSDVSGRGVGMDVVKTHIQRLNGDIEIVSQLGKGTLIQISLPLTLAILPVLLVKLAEQSFAVPLSMVREILPIEPAEVQDVGGRAVMMVRGELLPILPLTNLIGWPAGHQSQYGVMMQVGDVSFILAIDDFAGREDAVIKSLEDFRPVGVSGSTTLSNGDIVLILDMKELLAQPGEKGVSRQLLTRSVAKAA